MSTASTHPLLRAIRTHREALSDSYQRCLDSADKVAAAIRAWKPRVLYLEDDALVARSIQRFLTSAEVTIAASVQEALQLLGEKDFDLLLLDSVAFVLSVTTSTPYFDQIREEHPDLPCVVLSGKDAPEELPPGVEAWYQKNLSAEELNAIVPRHAKGILE